MNNSRLVYSTDAGRICPSCQRRASACVCRKKQSKAQVSTEKDGIIRIRREMKGRKGKTASVVTGFASDAKDLKTLAKQLKQHCGTGGSSKDGAIIIQGDHREKIRAFLSDKGYTVKLAGG